MLAKLLAYLAHAKGASIAIVVTVSAATATVGAATPEVQDAVRDIAAAVGLDIHGANALRGCDDQTGQPAVVAQRNAADKLLRAAYEVDHKALIDLRGGKDQDNKLVGDVVRNYDDQLRDARDGRRYDHSVPGDGHDREQLTEAQQVAQAERQPRAGPRRGRGPHDPERRAASD